MPKTSFRIPSSRIASLVWSSALLSGVALAQTSEGRQVAPLTVDSSSSYERKRLKRTVTLDSLKDWDVLYQTDEGRVFFNWDETYLYLAAESRDPQELRFDLDASGDGWFRGAENFSVRLVKRGETFLPFVRRFDTLQNKEHPVWAEVPLPEGSIQGRVLKDGAKSVGVVALPIALLGLGRKSGTELGLRILQGTAALAEPTPDQPLLRLQLAQESEAISGGLSVRLSVRNREYVAGALVRGTLELSNTGAKPLFLKSILLPDGTRISDPKDPSLIVNPKERIRREFRLIVPEGPEPASLVLRGGVEREEGGEVVALLSVDRLEPFSLSLDQDIKPILTQAPQGPARQRLLVATLTGRREGKTTGLVQLSLPEGWSVEGTPKRTLSLSYPGEHRSVAFKVVVPPTATAGRYPIDVICEIAGRTYKGKAEFVIQ